MQTHIRVLCHDGSSWLLRALTSCSTYIFLLLLLVSQSLLSCFVSFYFISCAKCTRDVRIFIRVKFISVWHPKFCQKEIRPRYVLIGNCTQRPSNYFIFSLRHARAATFILLFALFCCSVLVLVVVAVSEPTMYVSYADSWLKSTITHTDAIVCAFPGEVFHPLQLCVVAAFLYTI